MRKIEKIIYVPKNKYLFGNLSDSKATTKAGIMQSSSK